MDEAQGRPRAVVVLLRDGEEVLLGPVHAPDRCDLGFVEDLLRVQLTGAAGSAGRCASRGPPDLLELVELVGLRVDRVGDRQSSEKGGYSSVRSRA